MTTKKQKEIGDGGNSEGSSKSLVPSLPFDIIAYDILTRSPIDCLMPFRCVCKSWSSLILNDSDFIKLHSIRNCASPGFIDLSGNYPDSDDRNFNGEGPESFQDWQRGVKKSKGICFYDIEKQKYMLSYFRQGLFNKKLKIRGSFDGLVILSAEEGDREFSHHVYNPITCNSIKLPILDGPVVQRHMDDLYFHLVFDPIMEKFKVICIGCYYIEILPRQIVPVVTTQWFFKIVTLGTRDGSDSWRDINIPKMDFCLRGKYKALSANGYLNFLYRFDRKVLRIDVSRESYDTIEYPEGASKTSKLLEIEGSLCILDYTNSRQLDMDRYHCHYLDIDYMGKFALWFLTEDAETKRWIKKCDINMYHNAYEATPCKAAPVFVAAISNPTLKIIFYVSTREYEYDRFTEDQYYSYDVELKRLESIFRPDASNYRQWHFHRLTHI
ncbi:putative F-box protein At5g62660 [Papaver somniferum]|uniref:putative F-box protein At5g62660 n=1 Tax=Papaver somniferum TaxID=3469 RepID=UPI000E70524B|nr:putative F-box protein At5g62660 [Papaver somniferum]XP_026389032.1 putative F-box protein At5g62660 [Papaver somniferum]XP_026389037.1 putative F-box protein At5g62660 [Papaver somniferum]